jgi:hypothetical protein
MTTPGQQDVLIVACKHCHRNFRSPVQLDKGSYGSGSFELATLSSGTYQCVHCGQSATYDKADHHWGRPTTGDRR